MAIAGAIAALAGVTLFYTRRNRRGGCEEEYARWQAAKALYDEAMKAESDAAYGQFTQEEWLNSAMLLRDMAKAEVLGLNHERSANTEAMKEWEAKALDHDAQVVAAWAKLDTAKEAHKAATERRKELEAKCQEARRIYEECIGQASAVASTATVVGPSAASGPAHLGGNEDPRMRAETPPGTDAF